MKKAIVFDLYGTLVDIHTDETSQEFWSKFKAHLLSEGVIIDNLQARYHALVEKELKTIQHEFPDIEILKVFKALYLEGHQTPSKKQIEHTAHVFRHLSMKHLALYPGAISLLKTLKTAGLKVILLSNAQQAFTNHELNVLELRPYFDHIYLSSDYEMCKPNPLYFKSMLSDLDLKASDCIYIGNDHIADVGGAKSVGMEVIYLHTNCSQEHLPDFDCMLKVIPGDLCLVEKFLKDNVFGKS